MPDNLNITTPISGNTSINLPTQTPKEPPQINTIDPTRVTQANTNKQTEQGTNFDLLLNRNSVFSTFITQLRDAPALSQTLPKILFELFSRKENAKKISTSSSIIEQLTSSMKMEKADILSNLLFQSSNQTKFSEPLFDVLRTLSQKYPDSDFQFHLASFLKAYDGVFSAPNTMHAVIKQLDTLEQQMPRFYSKKLEVLTNQLFSAKSDDYISHNLTILKEQIIPMLSKYASKTKDIGKARDTITLLIHTLARLNVSSRQELAEKFTILIDYCRYSIGLPTEKISILQQLFAQKLSKPPQKPENQLYESLIKTLSEGTTKSTSPLSQALYKDTFSSLLLNNSVYMPFIHLFLPIVYHGQYLFSEIWIEKDPPNKTSKENEQRPQRIFLTFDIKNLGYFEMTMELFESKITVHINCPTSLQKNNTDIQNTISQILQQNGLTPESIVLKNENTPKVPEHIMQAVLERRSAIDVTI